MIKTLKAGVCFDNTLFDDAPQASVMLDPPMPAELSSLKAKASGNLIPGIHSLALSDRAARLEVSTDTSIELEIFCHNNLANHLSLKKLAVSMSKPIRLANLFTTMDEFRALIAPQEKNAEENELIARIKNSDFLNRAGCFLEKRASDIRNSEGIKKAGSLWREKSTPYLDRLTNSKGWKNLVSAAEKTSEKAAEISPTVFEKSKEFLNKAREFSEETIDKAIDGLELNRIEITSDVDELSDKKAHLHLKINGDGVISDKIRIPIKDIEIPWIFLSRFEPELTHLLSQFCVTSQQGTSLSKTFLGMVENVSGQFDASFSILKMMLGILMRGDRTLHLDIDGSHSHTVHGTFETSRNCEQLALNVCADVSGHDARLLSFRALIETTEDSLIQCGEKLDKNEWSLSIMGIGQDIKGRIEFEKGSKLYLDEIRVISHDPRLKYDIQMPLSIGAIQLDGIVDFGIKASSSTFFVHSTNLSVLGNAAWIEDIPLDIVKSRTTFSPCSGNFHLKLTKDDFGYIQTDIQSGLDVSLENHYGIEPVKELRTSDELQTKLTGHFDVHLHGEIETKNIRQLRLNFGKSDLHGRLEHFSTSSGIYKIDVDHPVSIDVDLVEGALTADGLAESFIKLKWALESAPLFHVLQKETELLLSELLDGHISVRISEQGKVQFEDGEGVFDEHFFNMLIYPEYEKAKIIEVAGYKPLLLLIDAAVRTLSEIAGPHLDRFLDRHKHWHARCQELGIQLDLRHAACPHDLAQMLSLFCFDSLNETESICQIIKECVQAKGFDRYKFEELLDRAFPDVDFSHFVPVLQMLNRIFKGIEFKKPEISHEESKYDEYSHRFRLLPSANQLFDFDTVSEEAFKHHYKYGGPCLIDTKATRARIYKYAAGYTIRQLEWLLSHHGDEFQEEQRQKLNRLIAIKRRIQKQEPREGSFLVQDFNIDYFLQALLDAEEDVLPHIGNISECLDDFTERCESDEVVECFASWLTPEDVGRLLSAGIASRIQNQIVQLNQARLLDYLVRRGKMFATAAFYEAGSNSDRILTSILMSFISQDQSLLKKPADRIALMSELLGIEFPNRQEYMSGGNHASESYFERLYEIAHQINASVTPYVAAKLRMQSDRISTSDEINEETPKRPPYVSKYSDEDELAELVRALEKADALGHVLVGQIKPFSVNDNSEMDERAVRKVEKAYGYAYRLASAVLDKYPDTFEKDVFKKFYARTYEALMIQTVDQNLMDDIDQVRKWFEVRSGISASEVSVISRIRRRNAIIDVLYYRENDRHERRNDPLTWIDIRPKEGPVNLTILAAMGVITEGKRGKELRTSFERLQEQRQIKIIRSDTGNIKSLAYNSSVIEEDMRRIKTPFMLIGYSQGCANMMRAESNMYASTPDDRACLTNLVARHFLYSALNGSPHAVCGGELYRLTLIDGEKYLKTLSATMSSALCNFLFDLLRKFLDSPVIMMSLNSVESLSYNGLTQLSQDAQYTPGVLSTEVQGIIKEFIPEALDYMTYHFDAQAHIDNDSQVGEDCSHGYHVYNRNDSVDILRREMIPTCTLKSHHWYPVYEEITYIETERDVKDAVYHAPMDIHIMPPIEALILFGKVKVKEQCAMCNE